MLHKTEQTSSTEVFTCKVEDLFLKLNTLICEIKSPRICKSFLSMCRCKNFSERKKCSLKVLTLHNQEFWGNLSLLKLIDLFFTQLRFLRTDLVFRNLDNVSYWQHLVHRFADDSPTLRRMNVLNIRCKEESSFEEKYGNKIKKKLLKELKSLLTGIFINSEINLWMLFLLTVSFSHKV